MLGSETDKRLDSELKKARLMRLLLERYSSIINDREKRTVGELKSLVSPEDLTVVSFLDRFKESEYDFDGDYLKVVEKVLGYFHENFSPVRLDLDISFWLSPQEVLEAKAGGEEDLAVFLCSVMQALGDKNAFVVVAELDSLTTKSFVLTSHKDKAYLLDPAQKHSLDRFSGSEEKALEKYSCKGHKVKSLLYRFNNSSYEQHI